MLKQLVPKNDNFMKKTICHILLFTFILGGIAHAAGGEKNLTRGAASLLVPGLGQYINGELDTHTGKVKTSVMILLEVGAIITTSIVGGVVGYPQVWAGIGIFLFNHLWSATDAYLRAPAGPEVSFKEQKISER